MKFLALQSLVLGAKLKLLGENDDFSMKLKSFLAFQNGAFLWILYDKAWSCVIWFQRWTASGTDEKMVVLSLEISLTRSGYP